MLYLISKIRNAFYDHGIIPTIKTGIPAIVVGNLSIGGTGKTPHSEYIINLLLERGFKPGFISRGYGRKTSGLIEIDVDSTPDRVGDEPLQVFRKFQPFLKACVSEYRVAGAAYLQTRYPGLNAFVLDDAFQHRRIGRNLNILLTTFKNPFYQDFLMPAGSLRESRHGAARADAVVVSKCPPGMPATKRDEMTRRIAAYSKAPVFFSTFLHGEFYTLQNKPVQPNGPVAVMTGIADGKAFANAVSKFLPVASIKYFADHHSYTKEEVDQYAAAALQKAASIITTEKDAVKLSALVLQHAASIYYLPVEVSLLFGEAEKFNQLMQNAVGGQRNG